MRPHHLLSVLFLGSILLLQAQTTLACSCGPKPTVLDAYEKSDVVLIARIVSVEKVDPKEKPDQKEEVEPEEDERPMERYVNNVRSTTVVVEKVYKGNVRVRDEIVFGQGGGADCVWTFNEELIGGQILFYLRAPEPPSTVWYAGTCGRSRGLEWAAEDLLYLDNMKKLRGKTRVSGNLASWRYPDLDVVNKKIRIVGEKKTYEAKTDEHGVYEIYDLPPGRYFVEPEIPKGWRLDRYSLRYRSPLPDSNSSKSIAFVLDPKKHASIDISFEPDNAVEGSIVGPDGNPMPEICAYLLAPGQNENWGNHGCTDKNGRFRIESIPAGTYVLVLNQNGKISNEDSYPTLFYPGVTQREKAASITIGNGETVKGINVVVPKLMETVTVSGVLLYSDDTPVTDDSVSFAAEPKDGIDGNATAYLDSEGRFTLQILKGVKGQIYSDFVGFADNYDHCPKLHALLKETGNQIATIKTPPIKIEADHNIYNLTLKFPFPRCKPKQ